MRRPFRNACGLLVVATGALLACSPSKEPPKTPLGQAIGGESAAGNRTNLSPEAKLALDRGNSEFRARKYEAALAAYREAARTASGNTAPYYGIYMAAEKLGNRSLADSASRVIQQSSGALPASHDSVMRNPHPDIAVPPRG
jgi:hypothetical protein